MKVSFSAISPKSGLFQAIPELELGNNWNTRQCIPIDTTNTGTVFHLHLLCQAYIHGI